MSIDDEAFGFSDVDSVTVVEETRGEGRVKAWAQVTLAFLVNQP